MFGRISRGISHASAGKKGAKYKISILVEKLDNLPAPVKRCRVVWSRGPKVQLTETKDVSKGKVAHALATSAAIMEGFIHNRTYLLFLCRCCHIQATANADCHHVQGC